MSHFTTIKTQFKDIDALRLACAELGLPLLKDAEARGYGGRTMTGDFIIQLKGPYDIALNHQVDGTYSITTDWWEGHVEGEVGKQCGKLLQLYAVHKATLEAKRKGHLVRRKQQPDGCIKLVIAAI
jgi:uncharacterized protein DUF1257